MAVLFLSFLQLIFMLCLCAIIGTPQAAFSSIEHFMLNEHIYEDRCRVLFSLENDVYCSESRAAYSNVYNTAGLAFALAVIPAIYSARYLGFSVTNLLCCLSLAGGSMVITSRPEDQWLNDQMAYGYALVAFAGPFAILNALSAISLVQKKRQLMIVLLFLTFATLQLSPLVWTVFSWQFSNSDLTVSDLFNGLLWVPATSMIITLALMPLAPSSQNFDLAGFLKTVKPHFFYAKTLRSYVESDEDSIISETANRLEGYADMSEISRWRSFFKQTFISTLLSYVVNSISIDLMYLGGESKALSHDELTTWVELTVWSPLIALCLSPVLILFNLKLGIRTGCILSYSLCVLLTLSQYLSAKESWLFSSMFTGVAQAALTLSTTLCLIKSSNTLFVGATIAAFLILCSLAKLWLLTVVEATTEFDWTLLGHNPYAVWIGLQLIFSAYSYLDLSRQSGKERRWYLELEAESACA